MFLLRLKPRLPLLKLPLLHVHRRERWVRLGLTILGLGAAAAARLNAEQKPPTFPAAVEIVTVDVVVTDKQGNPVAGLEQADFTLRENGTRQEITAFEAVTGGDWQGEPAEVPTNPRVSTNAAPPSRPRATFVIVFDEPHLDPIQASRGKRALERFLEGVVREGDRLRLVAAGRFALEGTRERLLEELPRLEGRRVHDETPEAMSDHEAMRITLFDDQPLMLRVMERMAVLTTGRHPALSEGERIRNTTPGELGLRVDEGHVKAIARGVYQDAVARNRATLRSLQTAIDDAAAIRGRKSVVLVSAGMMDDPEMEDGQRQVIDAARRANAALYFVDARGLEGIPGEAAEHGTYLAGIDQGIVIMSRALDAAGAEGLAADSGGFTVKNQNELLGGLRKIATESRSYYLLGYTPPAGGTNGKFRKIEVKVRRPGVEVRARKGYYSGASAAAGATAAPIPLCLSAYVYGESVPGKVHTLIVADVDPDALSLEEREGRFRDRLELGVVVTPRAGGEPEQFGQQVDLNLSAERRRALGTRGLPILRRFDLAPGSYLAQFAVRDLGSGRVGTVSHPFEVPDPSFRTSTPVLSDILEGGPGPDGVPAVGARRAFPEQSTLYFQFEVYGAAIDPAKGEPSVSSSYSIRDHAGIEWARVGAGWMGMSTAGVPARVGEISLTFKPGDYDLVVNVKDEVAGRTLEVKEPFSVGPARWHCF